MSLYQQASNKRGYPRLPLAMTQEQMADAQPTSDDKGHARQLPLAADWPQHTASAATRQAAIKCARVRIALARDSSTQAAGMEKRRPPG
jgi:hypothetical protein